MRCLLKRSSPLYITRVLRRCLPASFMTARPHPCSRNSRVGAAPPPLLPVFLRDLHRALAHCRGSRLSSPRFRRRSVQAKLQRSSALFWAATGGAPGRFLACHATKDLHEYVVWQGESSEI
eukprot:tig00020675_g12652.t1